MKKIFIFWAIVQTCTIAIAQTNQVVWLNGKVLYGHPITNIDSMTYDMNSMLDGDTLHLIMPRNTMHIVHDTIRIMTRDTIYIDRCGDEDGLATVLTTPVTHSTYNSLVMGGKVFFSSHEAITERGICCSMHTTPTMEDYIVKVGKGTGNFTATIVNLTESTRYYLRAYAINQAGISYGDEIMFTTPNKPTSGTSIEGAGSGIFSVSADKQVLFSRGNLQYQASTNTWRFAENQFDVIGEANANISKTYDGWIDLFGWGTSGFDNTQADTLSINYQPWAHSKIALSSIKIDSVLNCEMQPITGICEWNYKYIDNRTNNYGYGPSFNMTDYELIGTSSNYDWGVYNAISNGGNTPGRWRTPTEDEWKYIFEGRKNAQYLWAAGIVNGVSGIIILPDDFVKPANISFTYEKKSSNTYDKEQWNLMETAGAVFLPYAGRRDGLEITRMKEGFYWGSTTGYSSQADCLGLYRTMYSFEAHLSGDSRYFGSSVRLIQDIQ